ncbi:MAG: glycosyltransferase family 4 protein [Gemmatimonadales bacterium]
MRICKIWDGDYPWDVRVEKIAGSLTDAGHEVHLVARNRARRPVRERLAEAEVHRLKPWRLLGARLDRGTMFPAFFNPRWVSAVIGTARRSRAELLLVRDLPLAPTAVWAGRRLGIPVVLDMAENYPAMMRGLWETGVQRRTDVLVRNPKLTASVERWVLARADHVLVVVDESSDRLRALGVEASRITVVCNTPKLSRLNETGPKVHKEGSTLELIYLGLLEAPRGLNVLIDAVAQAREAGTCVRLTLLGDGRDRDSIEKRARALGLDETVVRFCGRVPYADAVRLLQRADVGVVPHVANESWNTTIPNKLFDYMAAGLAVLTSSAKPAARIVRETGAGVVFEHTKSSDCAAALGILARAEFRALCGANGRRAVESRFHWERDAERMVGAVNRIGAGLH